MLALYFIGFLIFMGGVAWALVRAGVPTLYVTMVCVILLGIGVMKAVTHGRGKGTP